MLQQTSGLGTMLMASTWITHATLRWLTNTVNCILSIWTWNHSQELHPQGMVMKEFHTPAPHHWLARESTQLSVTTVSPDKNWCWPYNNPNTPSTLCILHITAGQIKAHCKLLWFSLSTTTGLRCAHTKQTNPPLFKYHVCTHYTHTTYMSFGP